MEKSLSKELFSTSSEFLIILYLFEGSPSDRKIEESCMENNLHIELYEEQTYTLVFPHLSSNEDI